ncbi:hypothetical protein [Mycobacterium marinum]|uniref:hypothetical protein n=1 Tax=Mycobacterium marinum TaxID=1781 RepID=UPI0021C2FF54|nr:hypothetical protein [Mycobacterium marinum]
MVSFGPVNIGWALYRWLIVVDGNNLSVLVPNFGRSADSVSRVTVGGGSAVLARGSRKMRDAQIVFPDISRFRMSETIMPRRESVIPELR